MDVKTIGMAAGAVGLAGVVFVIGGGFLLPRHVKAHRTAEISASPATIHSLVGDLSRWEDWTAWNTQSDPSLTRKFEGKSTEVGGKMTWKGDLLGDGSITITKTAPETGLEYNISLQDGRFPATGSVAYTKNGEATTVTWTDDSDLGANPLSHWFGPMVEGAIGADFEAGLQNLKRQAEKIEADARAAPPPPTEPPAPPVDPTTTATGADGAKPPQPPVDIKPPAP